MVSLQARRIFFDTEEILKHLDAASIKVHSRFGAYVMTTARGSMRSPGKKGKPSDPGKPPKSRLGHVKKGAYGVAFGWDPATKSLVVGPRLFPGLKKRTTEATNLATIEEGGGIRFLEAQKKDGSWSFNAARWAKQNHSLTRERVGRYEARPFMQPALDKNLPKLSTLWANALGK